MRYFQNLFSSKIAPSLCFFVCFSYLAAAQKNLTVSGYVKEKSSGETLIGVTISAGEGRGTASNEYGFYSLSLPAGEHRLRFNYLGYAVFEKTVNLSTDLRLEVELESATTNLQEVVVSAKPQNEQVQAVEMGNKTISILTVKKLPAVIGEADVLRAIQLLPGVSSTSEASSGFNVRGGGADQNLILLDEATIYNATHLFGLFSVFNADAIKDVKLYKGGIPATYGGRLSSVLDVRQKEGNNRHFQGEAGIGLISSRLLLEGPFAKKSDGTGRGSFMLAGRRSYLDIFTKLSKEFRENKLYFYDLNFKTNYALGERNKIYLSGYFGRDNFKLPALVASNWGNASGTLRWTSNWGEKWFFQTSAIASRYDYSLDNLRSGYEFSWKSDILNFNIRPRATWYLNANNTVKIGADAVGYVFKPGQIAPLKNSPIKAKTFAENRAAELGLYASNEQKINSKFALEYGLRWSNFWRLGAENTRLYESGTPLRFDSLRNTYLRNPQIGSKNYASNEIISHFNALEPRLSMRYLLDSRNSIKLGYNKMYQYIHLISNTTSPTPLDIWTPSGPYIQPQNADQIALGYFTNLADDAYEVSIETYFKKINNLTDFVDGADLLFNENIESQTVKGRGRAYGAELQISKNSGRLTGWLSYTLAKSQGKIQGVNNGNWYSTNSDQRHQLNLVGFYKLTRRWELGGNFIFGSGRPVTYPSGKYQSNGLVVADFSLRNGGRLPAYHRLDLSATLNPRPSAKWEGQWVFSVINVYNRLNAASIFFREIAEVGDLEIATGTTQAVKTAFFPIIPSVSYNFKF
ncbi:MAG: hypothetical protein RIR11_143 [Bacteroidota bacterium]|jgi:hypothetical protein